MAAHELYRPDDPRRGAAPSPPSAFWARAGWAAAREVVLACARAGDDASMQAVSTRAARSAAAVAAGGAGAVHVTSRRARKRRSARTKAGPKRRQKTTLPTACATLKGSDAPERTRYCPRGGGPGTVPQSE